MLARFAGVLDEFSREQVEVHLKQASRGPSIDVRSHELEKKITSGEERGFTAIARVDDPDQKFEPPEISRESFEFVDEREADAAIFDHGERM